MRIQIKRFHFDDEYTIGRLSIDGLHECFTLEDAVREIESRPVSEWKIQDRTAIPRGRYKLAVTYSNRFRKPLPLLIDVPGFSGVRIHTGNHSGNTEGCILVGRDWDGGDWINQSRVAMAALLGKIGAAISRGEPVTVEVV